MNRKDYGVIALVVTLFGFGIFFAVVLAKKPIEKTTKINNPGSTSTVTTTVTRPGSVGTTLRITKTNQRVTTIPQIEFPRPRTVHRTTTKTVPHTTTKTVRPPKPKPTPLCSFFHVCDLSLPPLH